MLATSFAFGYTGRVCVGAARNAWAFLFPQKMQRLQPFAGPGRTVTSVYLSCQTLVGSCGCIFFSLLCQRFCLLRQIRNLRENSSRPELIIYWNCWRKIWTRKKTWKMGKRWVVASGFWGFWDERLADGRRQSVLPGHWTSSMWKNRDLSVVWLHCDTLMIVIMGRVIIALTEGLRLMRDVQEMYVSRKKL